MTTIELHTKIKAPLEVTFDLSRNIDLHLMSATQTQEQAISGRTSGLIGAGETVTWKGKHFGIFLKHTSKIVFYERPSQFTDIMVKGHFTYFAHRHIFENHNDHTFMIDILKYKVPFGFVGKWFDQFFLKKHLIHFLTRRNEYIKKNAEEKSPFPKKEALKVVL